MYAAVSAACLRFCQCDRETGGDQWQWAYQVVEFDCRYTVVDTRDDLLRNGSCINVLWIKAIAKAGNASCDLVELDAFFATIWWRK
jgi:hypothetical protein